MALARGVFLPGVLLILGTLLQSGFSKTHKHEDIIRVTLVPRAIPSAAPPGVLFRPSLAIMGSANLTVSDGKNVHLRLKASGRFPGASKAPATFDPTAARCRASVGLYYTANKRTYTFLQNMKGTWSRHSGGFYIFYGVTPVTAHNVNKSPGSFALVVGVRPTASPSVMYVSWGRMHR